MPHRHNGYTTDLFTIRAPVKAPANIRRIDAVRRCHRGLPPPAKDESAANPVIVIVKTVVVRSGTPSFRAVAFLRPMASAVSPMTPRSGIEIPLAGFTDTNDTLA